MADHLPKFKPGQAVTFTAGGAITGGQVVALAAYDRTVEVAEAASPYAIGTAGHDAASGDKVTVHLAGPVDTAAAETAVTVRDLLEIGGGDEASGTVRTLDTGPAFGLALTSAAPGARVEYIRVKR